MLSDNFDTNTVWDDLLLLLESVVIRLDKVGESEFSGDEDLLSTWELELGSSQGFLGESNILNGASDGHKNLSNTDSSTLTEGFTEGTSHTLLKSISTGTRKHLVNSDNMEWMDSNSHVEIFSSNVSSHVLVASDSGRLKSLGGNLLLLVANEMDTSWELVMTCLLLTDIVNSKLWIWYTSVESGLWIWLVLLVPVAPCWSSSHF